MSTKTDFVAALLTACSRVYVANQSPSVPVYPLILYELTQDKPAQFADNEPVMQQIAFWVYFYAMGSVTTLEAAVDAALPDYSARLIRETTNGNVISKIKEYMILKEV